MLKGIKLSFYTEEEIQKLCVVKVNNAATYDRGVPRIEGINDPRLGVSHQTTKCPTCSLVNCDQHLGYVELATPVYRLGTINYVLQILRCVCRECAKPKFTDADVAPLRTYTPKDRLRALSETCRNRFACPHCKAIQPMYVRRDRIILDITYRPKDLATVQDPKYRSFLTSQFTPEEARAILEGMTDETKATLSLTNPEHMVVRLQIVPPPIIRPSNFVGETKVRSENDLTVAIQDIVRASIETETDPAQWTKLQVMQASLVNHTIKKTVGVKMGVVPSLVASNKRKINDLKTRLSGKKGRFRGNLAGKRVDQSGRSVIGPDSSHDITELGVPSHVMNTLTFPERVTTLNRAKLARCVMIGPYKDGGAMAVKQPHALPDALIWLPVLDTDGRADLAAQLAVGWIVERHLIDGDWALFNRQPSLWKASMMAFTIYRVPTLCFRLPLPVTKPFNADFDGDEMNFHSLQDHSAIAEAQELLSVPHQMMNPQSNSVIIGLVQDSLVGGFRMTQQDTFITVSDMYQLAMCRHYDPRHKTYKDMGHKDTLVPTLEEPAILKSPRGPLYTGKQLVSFLLPDISLAKAVRTENLWNDDSVVIRNGCLLTGQLCKATLGATNHGIIQAVFGKYGPWAACKFVSDAQRTFVTFLATHGPSISMLDCMVETPKEIIQTSLDKAAQIINLDLPYEVIEAKSSSVLQETLRNVGGTVAGALQTSTGLYTVVTSGSKGNLMNIAQIAGCVGQQTVFGRRIPMRGSVIGKRTLAYFAPDDTSPQSRGFIARSYREGLRPEEFFYHQMAGREGIVATAVNTADSGYNQRRMIKSQESQCVAYDGTVRVCADNIVQISYGYDDMDGASVCRFRLSADIVTKAMQASGIVKRCAEFIGRVLQMRTILLKDLDTTVVCPIGSDAFVDGDAPDLQGLYDELIACHATLHRKPTWRMTLPAAVTIVMFWQRPGKTVPDVVRRYQGGLIQAGEGVGAIAATSIGEPSMQMTLNVFHYTGIASKNVTITGLPRFRQLINAVDTYETSNMTAEVTSFEEAPKNIGAVTLGEIADIEVSETKNHEFITSFIGLQAGALVAKVQKKKVAVSKSPWCVVARIRWNAAEQHKLRTTDVATALRKVLGLEAVVVCPPYWAPNPSVVIVPVWVHGLVSARQWVESIAENLSNVIVSGIPGIKRSLVLQEPRWDTKLQKSSVFVIDTEGSSLVEFVKLPGIKRSSAVTNNVVEIARTLGITAGVLVLQAELHKVLSFDSSYVDPRHTWLLADTMCRAGSVCATNRHNMQSLGNSVLQRASFEQSLEVFHEGAVFGMYDPLTGSTERIMVGQPAKVGTGMVSVVTQASGEPGAEPSVVAPLNSKHTAKYVQKEDDETFVRPLRHNETFCLDNHSTRVTDESKDSDDTIAGLFAQWRSHAGAFREAAQVTATQTVTRAQLDAILVECKTCGTWAQTQQSTTTRVYYNSTTTIVDSAFTAVHYTRQILAKTAYDDVVWEVFADRKTLDLPTSIVPDNVEIVHTTEFIKNGFVLQARKTFSGTSNMDAERAAAQNACTCTLQVSMASPEAMLQVRATNGQFANAYIRRLS